MFFVANIQKNSFKWGQTLMTTNPFMIFLNNWELILKYQHFLLDPYPFQGMIREPTQAVHAHM